MLFDLIKYSGFLGSSPIAFGQCIKPIVEFQFRSLTQYKSYLSEGKLFRPRHSQKLCMHALCTLLLRLDAIKHKGEGGGLSPMWD